MKRHVIKMMKLDLSFNVEYLELLKDKKREK